MSDDIAYESKTWRGFFWIPNSDVKKHQDNKIPGFLSYDPEEGIKLTLMFPPERVDVFKLIDFVNKSDQPRIDVILGICDFGPVTLFDCAEISIEHHLNGILYETFIVGAMIKGYHFKEKDEAKIKEITATLPHLDEWLGVNVIEFNYYREKKKIELEAEPTMPAKVDCGFAEISLGINLHSQMTLKEARIQGIAEIRVAFKEDRSIEEAMDFLDKIEKFLIIAIGSPVFPLKVTGKVEAEKIGQITIYQPFPFYAASLESFRNKIVGMVFTFSDIEGRFEKILENWLNIINTYSVPINRYISTFLNQYYYNQDVFLQLVRSLEGYHRLKNNDDVSPLNKIIESLINQHKDIMKIFLTKDEMKKDRGISQFTHRVVKTRNYLEHTKLRKGVKRKYIVSDPIELFFLREKLKVLFHSLILKDLGFDESEIEQFIKRWQKRGFLHSFVERYEEEHQEESKS